MPRESPALTRSLLATYRPGAVCCVAEGFAVGIPKRRPTGYLRHPRTGAMVSGIRTPSAAPPVGPGVGVLQIRGVMTAEEEWFDCGEAPNYVEITSRFCDAMGDPGVGALVFDAKTPGGDLDSLEESVGTMLKAKLASGKPVLGYVGTLAASAGVWLLAPLCDFIYLHPSARMGSIGVLVGHETDARKALADGIDRTIVRDPPGKANPNPDELLDELGLSRLQAIVTEARTRFAAAVAVARRIDPTVILGWNGGMFTGNDAVVAGLANGTGTLETTIQIAGSLAEQQEAA